MMNFSLLVIGDVLSLILMGFYAGVGIRESAEAQHILFLTLPGIIVWLLSTRLLKLYPAKSAVRESLAFSEEASAGKQMNYLLNQAVKLQRIPRLLLAWLIYCIFSVCWQIIYWHRVLHSSYGFGIVPLFIWYSSACIFFLFFWRVCWTLLICLRELSHNNHAVRTGCLVLIGLIVLYQIPAICLTIHYAPQRLTLSEAEAREDLPDTAIVFGAGVYQNGRASVVLIDRVDTAVDLYQAGSIDRMILSGDNSAVSRNEVDVMTKLALNAGVPESALIQDEVGLHTPESCQNAHDVYGLNEAVMVSQNFHNTRILLTCEEYGVNGVTVSADRSVYNIHSWLTWNIVDWLKLPSRWFLYTFLH